MPEREDDFPWDEHEDPPWRVDETGGDLITKAVLKQAPVYVALVPLALCVPFDPDYRGDVERKQATGEDRRMIEWLDTNTRYLTVYQRGSQFVVFSDYLVYYGFLEDRPEYVPCAIVGEVHSEQVKDLRGPLDPKDIGYLLRFMVPDTEAKRRSMPIYDLLEDQRRRLRASQAWTPTAPSQNATVKDWATLVPPSHSPSPSSPARSGLWSRLWRTFRGLFGRDSGGR